MAEGAGNLATALAEGFAQGQKISVERKRLMQEEKTQEALNQYRMRQLEQEKSSQQQQLAIQQQLADQQGAYQQGQLGVEQERTGIMQEQNERQYEVGMAGVGAQKAHWDTMSKM